MKIKYLIYFLFSIFVLWGAALFQYQYILNLKPEPEYYFVPTVMGILFGLTIMWIIHLNDRLKDRERKIARLNEELKKEVDLKRQALENIEIIATEIFNNQPTITVLTTGKELRMVNKTFFKYFSEYESLEDFKKKHRCICEFFKEKKGYIKPQIDDLVWIEYLEKHPKRIHKAVLNINGKEYIMAVKAAPFYLNKEKLYVVVFNDITELEHANKRLEYMLYHDELTGLPNRRSLIKDIRGRRKKEGLCLVNIDNFKSINDVYGVKIGDDILKEVSKRLTNCVRRRKTKDIKIYKLHADEFAVLHFHKKESLKEYIEIINEVIDELTEKPYVFGDYEIYISVSIGISLIEWVEGHEDLLPSADVALKAAKSKRKHYLFYKDVQSTKRSYEENILWTKKIVKAIKNDRMKIFYQPIYSIKKNKITKVECLVRMIDEDGTMISPAKFLRIAKISKLYPEITKAVINKSFKECSDCSLDFSINIDIQDMTNDDIVDWIKKHIKEYNVGNRLIFEFLETESIENYEIIKDFIEEMREYGCRFAIDDFGSGYSNMERLMELKINYLKIDSSFIKRMLYDRSAEMIVKLINDFAHSINAETIAEFVSSKEIFDKVAEMGIDYAQGYYISEPIPDINNKLFFDSVDRFIV